MLLWSGQTLSQLGSQISLVAYPLLVLALTGSPAKAGVAGFAKTVPVAVWALPAGVLVDRVNRKHLMVACDGVRALALAAIPIALATGALPYGLIVAVAFLDGSGFVVSYIAERGALRQLVPREQLSDAGCPQRVANVRCDARRTAARRIAVRHRPRRPVPH
jgi:MFS family permease